MPRQEIKDTQRTRDTGDTRDTRVMNDNQNLVSFLSEKLRRKQSGATAEELAATMYAFLASERAARSQQYAEANGSSAQVICVQSMRAL